MNEDVKRKWVEALTSGRYAQAHKVLRTETGYCCLGVLCDLAVRSGIDLEIERRELDLADSPQMFYSYNANTMELPQEVVTWAGTSASDPSVFYDGHYWPLSALNDGEGECRCTYVNENGCESTAVFSMLDRGSFTFAEIAAMVDEQL